MPSTLNNYCKIFHAGTEKVNNEIVINGGRVLAVTAIGENLANAQRKAYETVKTIAWESCHYRTDIGQK